MKPIIPILTFNLGIAVGALAYHLILHSHPTPTSTQAQVPALNISHSSADPERSAMETLFAHQYARLHNAKDLDGLLAMGKFQGVWDNIISSRKTNLLRSFSQQITHFTFRELSPTNTLELSDLSLPPVLQYTVTFAQPDPHRDILRSRTGILGIDAGRLYMVDHLKN